MSSRGDCSDHSQENWASLCRALRIVGREINVVFLGHVGQDQIEFWVQDSQGSSGFLPGVQTCRMASPNLPPCATLQQHHIISQQQQQQQQQDAWAAQGSKRTQRLQPARTRRPCSTHISSPGTTSCCDQASGLLSRAVPRAVCTAGETCSGQETTADDRLALATQATIRACIATLHTCMLNVTSLLSYLTDLSRAATAAAATEGPPQEVANQCTQGCQGTNTCLSNRLTYTHTCVMDAVKATKPLPNLHALCSLCCFVCCLAVL